MGDRTLRDVVALSILPAVWQGAEPLRVVESLAASLFSVLEADFVYVTLQGDAEHEPIAVAQTGRNRMSPELASRLGPELLAWALKHDPEDPMALPSPFGEGTLHILVRPIAIDAEYGLIAAGFLRPPSPDTHHQLLMNVAATQATTTIENIRLLRSVRRHAAQQRAAMEEAQAARAEAEAASRAKDEFLAILGHELRNPLAPIQTAIQLLRLRGAGALEQAQTVIERQVQHLTRLIDDLLDVSRITRGKVELRREHVQVRDVVAKGLELASPLIEQRRHTLHVEVPREDLYVNGDPLRLAQVMANLLANAAKYTEQAGAIWIQVEALEDQVCIRVRDTGIGIRADILPQIFDLFVQERQTLERSQGGLGLGLTIVRSLVRMHDGTVSARSDGPGLGAEFVVRLPRAFSSEARALQRPRPSPRDPEIARLTQHVRVLVVDDNEDAADMMQAALSAAGYGVRTAHDGPAALRVAAEFRPHVALLDIGLPVMDGYELAARLRELPNGRDMHLFAVTGYAQDTDRERSHAAGFERHFAKPLDIDVLELVLRETVSAG